MWWTLCSAFAAPVTVPVDVGVGPAAHLISGPVARDQLLHAGLSISIQAVLDKRLIRKLQHRIPSQYRSAALQLDELRFSPSIFIPDTLFLSPAFGNTGIYGLSWRPIGVGVPLLSGPVRLDLGAGLRLTTFYLHSEVLPNTFFFRPGVSLRALLEIPLTETVLVSLGCESQVTIPQELGGFGIARLDESIWNLSQASLMVHVRVPYTLR